jgi:rod shape determining protein RodA
LLSLYFFLILRVFFIASKADKFSTLLSFGIAAYMFWQLFVNIGMVIGILPVVGITLPLVSYGGTSVISFYVSLGLVSSVAARRQSFK